MKIMLKENKSSIGIVMPSINKTILHRYGHTVIIYSFLIVLVAFVNLYNSDFMTLGNFKNLLKSSLPLLFVSLGQTLIILTGGIDLSLGAIVALTNVVCVTTMNPDAPGGFILPIILALMMGLICGLFNGLLITKGSLAPIIVTLASGTIISGVALLLMPEPGGSVHRVFSRFLTRGINGSMPLIMLIIVVILIRLLTDSTALGKSIRAIGGNEQASYSTGIKVNRTKIIVYALAGLLCALAGIFISAQMNSADPTIGKNYAINAITASVVGGLAMTGAVGDPIGTLAGVMIITIINNMLNLFGVSSFYQFICQGLILIFALTLSSFHKK